MQQVLGNFPYLGITRFRHFHFFKCGIQRAVWWVGVHTPLHSSHRLANFRLSASSPHHLDFSLAPPPHHIIRLVEPNSLWWWYESSVASSGYKRLQGPLADSSSEAYGMRGLARNRTLTGTVEWRPKPVRSNRYGPGNPHEPLPSS